MPENFIISNILDKKDFLEIPNKENINPSSISISQYTELKASLSIFGFNDNDIDTDGIETLFKRGYLNKIAGNEQKLIDLKDLGFEISPNSLNSLCTCSIVTINESIEKFEKLGKRLLVLKDVGFSFNGVTFPHIKKIPEFIIDKIISLKDKLIILKPFGVEFDLKDYEYFNIDEETVNKLVSLEEKLKLAGKIGLKISLKNICSLTITERERRKSRELEGLSEIKSEILEIINPKKSKKNDIIIENFNKINTEKISFVDKIKKGFGEKIFSILNDSNYSNSSFLDEIDESTFDKALVNIDLLSILLKKTWIVINIKEFLELSYLFDKPDVIKNIITLMDNGLSISHNDLKNHGNLFEKLDEETTGYIIKMKVIHSGDKLDDMNLINHVVENKDNVKRILENEEKYKKLVGLYKTILGSEEMMFENGEFKEDIIEILESQSFDDLEGIFKEALNKNRCRNEIFYPKNLAFIIKITSKNPGDLTKFIFTYLNKDFSIEFINFLNKQNINDLREFLLGLNKEFLIENNKYCNEYTILLHEFGFEVNKDIKNITYLYNIMILLSGSVKPSNITSTNQIFNKLSKTGFQDGKITKDNIVEIGVVIANSFKVQDIDNKYLKEIGVVINNIIVDRDIDLYKKVVRALGDYMYSRDFEEDFAFQDLLKIFGEKFNSNFLGTLMLNTGSETFKYLLSKKVRLQDIERIYNNYQYIFMLDLDSAHNKFCLDYAIENDNYDYLAQNIETLKYIINNDYNRWCNNYGDYMNGKINNDKIKNIVIGLLKKEKNPLKEYLNDILNFTGGYLTISMIKGYIEDGKSLEDLLEESIEAKKEVLSPNPITHLNLATYETIFLAYRPTGFTIESIRKNIENGNIADMSHHLEGIKYNPLGYDMEFFQRNYSLEGEQEQFMLSEIDSILKGSRWKDNIFEGLNLKLFFSQATELFEKRETDGEIIPNYKIIERLQFLYRLNDDARINVYRNNFVDGSFNYERIIELKEIFSVVTKDSFDKIIGDEIGKLSDEEQLKLWESIGKIKDKNVKIKYNEINEKDVSLKEKIKELFIWRFLGYASQIRKYITTEMKKFKEVKGKQTRIKAQLSKNVGSFFAKAGAGLCTSENYEMWKEQRHIHLNLIDEQRQEIIGNVMLYFEPGRNYLVVRGFNPRIDIESSYEVNHMVDEMIRVVKEIAVQNGYIDENGEALVYIPPQDGYHAVSNREKVRKRMKYIVGKVGEEIHDTKFSANREGVRIYNTLHRI